MAPWCSVIMCFHCDAHRFYETSPLAWVVTDKPNSQPVVCLHLYVLQLEMIWCRVFFSLIVCTEWVISGARSPSAIPEDITFLYSLLRSWAVHFLMQCEVMRQLYGGNIVNTYDIWLCDLALFWLVVCCCSSYMYKRTGVFDLYSLGLTLHRFSHPFCEICNKHVLLSRNCLDMS